MGKVTLMMLLSHIRVLLQVLATLHVSDLTTKQCTWQAADSASTLAYVPLVGDQDGVPMY